MPRGTRPDQVWNYEPYWEHEKFSCPDYQFQTPLTQLELFCYDGYAWVIICERGFSEKVKKALPQAKDPDAFYAETQS